MKKIFVFIAILMCSVSVYGQVLKGYVYDAQTSEPLVGVAVLYQVKGEEKGVATDKDGYYELVLNAGGNEVVFSYLGYEDEILRLVINPREDMHREVYMKTRTELLQEVVISAGRFEQKLSEITVSMDIMKAEDLQRQSPTDISAALNTLPGVDIVDKQPSIRGGGGWTYGVGARSQILVDGMSILNSGNGEIHWNSIPLENVEQVEVIKGASSVLYGSSALNGIINVRTSRPGLKPQTKIKTYVGIYGNPANDSYQWWDKGFWKDGKYDVQPFLRRSALAGVRNPLYEGLDITHSRRIGNFDVTGSLDIFTDEGYRMDGYNQRFRFGGNLTYYHPSENIINYGLNLNVLSHKYGDFFIWRSPLEAYTPSPFSSMGREGNSIRIDPFFNFVNPVKNTSHKVKTRFYYRGDNIINTSSQKSLTDILGNMGTDIGQFTDILGRIQGGDYSDLTPIIPPLLNGDLNGVIDGVLNVTNKLFPDATTPDLADLISWFMKHGIPSGSSDLAPWLSNAMNYKPGKTYIDKFYTYYADYQFSKKIGTAQLTTGLTYEHLNSQSEVTGTHNSDNAAVYFQYDQRFFDRLSVSLGFRAEYYRVDEEKREAETKIFGANVPVKPIFRGGLNYQLAEYSFLRASFGQGYRYPSIVEKYARKDIGGVGVFPNGELKAESGVNAELGFKQGYKFGNFQGFVDAAGFFTQYKDMVEFRFGLFNDTTFEYINSVSQLFQLLLDGESLGIGAQFYNVSKARIYGLDISTNGVYTISPRMKVLYNLGYVFIEPLDVDYKKKNRMEDQYTDPLQMKEKSNNSKYLKYRQKHTVKATLDYQWNRLTVGTNMTWKSKTLAVDYFMIDERHKPGDAYEVMDYVRDIMFGSVNGKSLASYWRDKNKGYFVMDLRLGVKATDFIHFQFMVNNVFNKEYCTRPMAISAPRTWITQVNFTF